MIHYDNVFEEMTVTCDDCHDEITIAGTFQECIAELKSYGWRVVKDEYDNYTHFCRQCEGVTPQEDFK